MKSMQPQNPKAPNPEAVLPSGCVQACRACPHRGLTREQSLLDKENWVRRNFPEEAEKIHPILGSSLRWKYRERAVLHVEKIAPSESASDTSVWRVGLFQDEVVLPIPKCPIHSDRLNRVIENVRVLFPSEFFLRFIVVNGRILTLVLKQKRESISPVLREGLNKILEASASDLDGIYISWNPSAGNRVLSVKTLEHGAGKKTSVFSPSRDTFFQEVEHGPTQFLQTHFEIYSKALQKVFRFHTNPNILDLYMGLGLTTRVWASHGFSVLGVDLALEAVSFLQGKPGIQALQGRVGDRIPQIEKWIELNPVQAIHLNPSRLGVGKEVLEKLFSMKNFNPRTLSYLSCSVKSLREDAETLKKWGWVVHEIQPFDFFPQTKQVEVLLLARKFVG